MLPRQEARKRVRRLLGQPGTRSVKLNGGKPYPLSSERKKTMTVASFSVG
ncbi:hypothetical protein GCM10027190_39500 [Spirosoma areae]